MGTFRFLTNCVNCPGSDAGEAIQDMVSEATPITRRTFLKHVNREDLAELESALAYAKHPRQGLTMAGDWHVGYFKGHFRGKPCYYFGHSRIEHIFVKED